MKKDHYDHVRTVKLMSKFKDKKRNKNLSPLRSKPSHKVVNYLDHMIEQ